MPTTRSSTTGKEAKFRNEKTSFLKEKLFVDGYLSPCSWEKSVKRVWAVQNTEQFKVIRDSQKKATR